MTNYIEGKVVVITGASSGLGAATDGANDVKRYYSKFEIAVLAQRR